MPACAKIAFKRRSMCAGDLDRKIKIKSRAIKAPMVGVDYSENFEDVKTVWSSFKSVKGINTFYLTNLDVEVDHVFGFRWFEGLTAENWIEYGGKSYDIVVMDNLDERNEWYFAYCNLRGVTSAPVNHA